MAGQKCKPHLHKFFQNGDKKQHATCTVKVAYQLHKESAGLARLGDKEPELNDIKDPNPKTSNNSGLS